VASVAWQLMKSGEYRDLTVRGYYLQLLHRPAQDSEAASWAQSSTDLASIRLTIENSGEYFQHG
jgi:hypothetical protein